VSLYLERLRDAIRPPSHVECADRALAQTVKRNDELVGIIRKVRRIHTPKPWMGVQMCDECMRRYPCPTIKTLDGEAATQDESEVE
jgi:hypothetical protein